MLSGETAKGAYPIQSGEHCIDDLGKLKDCLYVIRKFS